MSTAHCRYRSRTSKRKIALRPRVARLRTVACACLYFLDTCCTEAVSSTSLFFSTITSQQADESTSGATGNSGDGKQAAAPASSSGFELSCCCQAQQCDNLELRVRSPSSGFVRHQSVDASSPTSDDVQTQLFLAAGGGDGDGGYLAPATSGSDAADGRYTPSLDYPNAFDTAATGTGARGRAARSGRSNGGGNHHLKISHGGDGGAEGGDSDSVAAEVESMARDTPYASPTVHPAEERPCLDTQLQTGAAGTSNQSPVAPAGTTTRASGRGLRFSGNDSFFGAAAKRVRWAEQTAGAATAEDTSATPRPAAGSASAAGAMGRAARRHATIGVEPGELAQPAARSSTLRLPLPARVRSALRNVVACTSMHRRGNAGVASPVAASSIDNAEARSYDAGKQESAGVVANADARAVDLVGAVAARCASTSRREEGGGRGRVIDRDHSITSLDSDRSLWDHESRPGSQGSSPAFVVVPEDDIDDDSNGARPMFGLGRQPSAHSRATSSGVATETSTISEESRRRKREEEAARMEDFPKIMTSVRL